MKKYTIINRLLLLIMLLTGVMKQAWAVDERYAAQPLKGNQLRKDSSCTVADTIFINHNLAAYSLRNIITFKINEFANLKLPDVFDVTISFNIYYTKRAQDEGQDPDSITNQTLTITYRKESGYDFKAIRTFSKGYQVRVKITDINATVPLSQIENSLMLENEILVKREYGFSCTDDAVKSINTHTYLTDKGELQVSWPAKRGPDEYDLEWTYIDSAAARQYLKSDSVTYNATAIFLDNASRVSIAANTYRIPLLYEAHGFLFYRVRAVQVKQNGQRLESEWSTAYGGLGKYEYDGHEGKLNWQASTSFAEEGKRKSVVQYFDGSLRNRQTVTKDNTTDTTIIAETFYDNQGRPVIQVLPTPSLSSMIKYTPKFNAAINGAEYDKDLYDGLLSDSCYCKQGAPALGTSSGAAQYYSPYNLSKLDRYNQYIPDAKGYPFSETRYVPDNTGRISLQSGVGQAFQIDSGRATQYIYSDADQEELDVLFGTDVGNATHYFKNMVRDANGQYSVSYVDMHGRTIATALAGTPLTKMDKLESNKSFLVTKDLIGNNSNLLKGRAIESSSALTITEDGDNRFRYTLQPDSISIKTCGDTTICYDCLYDLEITITDECNNTTLPGAVPYVIKASRLRIDTACGPDSAFPAIDNTVFLRKGTYMVTKRLTISKQGMDAYRAVFVRRNTCKTFDQFVAEQKAALALQCEPTCTSCYATLGTKEAFRQKFMLNNGISNADTARYRDAAWMAYDKLASECEDLCREKISSKSIREQMLLDVTAPTGQYANPADVKEYSIFRKVGNSMLFTTVSYKDMNGLKEELDLGQMSPNDFAAAFKPSWAVSLLPLHPEYAKLLRYEKLSASQAWDIRFESTDTYQAAVDSGFLNPAAFTGLPAQSKFAHNSSKADSFFLDPAINKKADMQDSLFNYVKVQGGSNISAWSLATIMAHCPARDGSCLTAYSNTAQSFSLDTACSGEMDMAWRYFRQFYLQKKREIITDLLDAAALAEGKNADYFKQIGDNLYALNFPAKVTAESIGITTDTNQAKAKYADSLAAEIDRNCRAYAEQWWEELRPCGIPDSQKVKLINRLIAVCKEGGDADHLFGASTVKPSSALSDRSFEQVVKAFVGANYNSACNVYQLTAPLPYESQPVYYDKPVVQKPDSCECSTITKLYSKYQSVGRDASFSAYLLRTAGTNISEGKLDTLRKSCTGEINCSMLKEIIYLPPVLQCRGGQTTCATCTIVDTLYNRFKQQFPGIEPAFDASDSLQRAYNTLFESYMNKSLAFGKTTQEYLDFLQRCGTIPPGNNYLITLKKDYFNDTDNHGIKYDGNGCDTSSWKVYHPGAGAGNNTGITHNQIFKNGILKFPDTLNRAGRPNTLDYDVIGKDSACVERHFSLEMRVKYPMQPASQNHNFYLEMYFGFNPVQKYYFANNRKSGYSLAAYYDFGSAANSREYVGESLFIVDYTNWRVVKYECIDSVLKFYVDGQLVRTLNFPAGIALEKLKGFSIRSTTDGNLPISLDYVKAYDKNGKIFYNEEFSDCSNFSYFLPYIRCPRQNCADAFTAYFNRKQLTSYTKVQIDSIYAANGVPLDVCDANFDGITLCGKTQPVFPLVPFKQRTTCDDSTLFAISKGTLRYEAYRDSLLNSFEDRYLGKCLRTSLKETFTVDQRINEFHYTLYYYDQAGNLTKTVPPAGVDVSKFAWTKLYSDSVKAARRNGQILTPNHTLYTIYRYNSLNQVVTQHSPDGGRSNFWYDRLGRLVVSQNAKQRQISISEQDRQYSYTQYDSLGRITEVGQMNNLSGNGAMNNAISRNPDNLQTWLLALAGRREQVTSTIYDKAYGWEGSFAPAATIVQRNLRNRVSYTSYKDIGHLYGHNQATFYTYDILGNVDTLLQDYGPASSGNMSIYNMMNRNGNQTKKFVYQYDLISGKVNKVMYQPGFNDQWLHRYSYDAENRLTLVETSTDDLVWEKDARYEYYKHGPLARTVLGEQLVQGVDYAYTLQGWLKGVNSTGATENHDIGGDGKSGNSNQFIARDALGFNLNYFDGDFQPINATASAFPSYRITGGLPDRLYRPLYNGNISSMATFIRKFESNGAAYLYDYQYDQLNRLTGQRIVKGFDRVSNKYDKITLAANLNDSVSFNESVAYDGNGNITKYRRYGYDSEMDSLTYKYYANSNKLRRVRDNVPATRYGSGQYELIPDIDDQASEENYVYDAIGNLIEDKSEGNTQIKWNVYGKIIEITRTIGSKAYFSNVKYNYDAQGNRIGKVAINYDPGKSGYPIREYTWYVRDGQGNLVTTYKAEKPLSLDDSLATLPVEVGERQIYGSSRLGTYILSSPTNDGPADIKDFPNFHYARGDRQYELSNHLGNVLSTISDKKIGVSSGAVGSLIDYYEPDIISATDYYPFGMVSRVSLAANGQNYRFGFNGKENDHEAKGAFNQQDYGMRIYDPRLGRFLSVDPLAKSFPYWTPYQFSGDNPIRYIDLDGAEQYDPQSKPTGIVYLNVAKAPGVAKETKSIHFGNYELRGIVGENGQSYWIARYHFKEGRFKGMYNDEWVVGVDGVKDLARDPEKYHNKYDWLTLLGGPKQLSVSNMARGYVSVMTNPLNWIGGVGILASSYKGLLRGTLSDFDARQWYLAGEREIPKLLNTKLPLEEQAKQAFNIRNQLRTEARELMADRAKAAEFNANEINLTWDQVIQKAKDKGFSGDDIWREIINSAQRSRQSVNKSLGIQTNK